MWHLVTIDVSRVHWHELVTSWRFWLSWLMVEGELTAKWLGDIPHPLPLLWGRKERSMYLILIKNLEERATEECLCRGDRGTSVSRGEYWRENSKERATEKHLCCGRGNICWVDIASARAVWVSGENCVNCQDWEREKLYQKFLGKRENMSRYWVNCVVD